MSVDFTAKEREFIDGLKPDTGRDLAEWMTAISAQRLAHRNDIIDWLRQQGFMFARASWLERIHNNGGRPIYVGSAGPVSSAAPVPPEAVNAVSEPVPPAMNVGTAVSAIAAAGGASVPAAGVAGALEIEAVLVKAKAYRPLAEHVLREVRKAVPGVIVGVRPGQLVLSNPVEFAVLAISARDLRLGLALGDHPFDPLLQKARLPGIGAAITHMTLLTDARQVSGELMGLVARAARGR